VLKAIHPVIMPSGRLLPALPVVGLLHGQAFLYQGRSVWRFDSNCRSMRSGASGTGDEEGDGWGGFSHDAL